MKTRRNHVAELINNQILIHGGLSDDNTIMNDIHLFNIIPYKWLTVSLSEDSVSPALYGHTATLVLPIDIRSNSKLNIYRIPEDKIQRRNLNRIKEKGIYIFGGKSNENILSNDLYIIKIGKKPLEISKLEVSGAPPCPRYLHTINYYEEGNFLILFGGRDDINEDYAKDDIFILELSKLEWIEVKVYFDSNVNLFPRCSHCSIIVGNKFIVFGGMNNNNYIGSSLFFVELGRFYFDN